MGCFLQKVNIIRDLQKDFHQKRIFWPLKDLPSFSLPSSTTHDEIVGLKHDDLNLLCLDAVTQHYDAVIDYLAQLRNPGIFRFCAVPVLMALASLAKLYDHPAFFTVKVIKLSKLQSIQVILLSLSLSHSLFSHTHSSLTLPPLTHLLLRYSWNVLIWQCLTDSLKSI